MEGTIEQIYIYTSEECVEWYSKPLKEIVTDYKKCTKNNGELYIKLSYYSSC